MIKIADTHRLHWDWQSAVPILYHWII